MSAYRPESDRFWAKVQKGDGCWVWTGVRRKTGYGQFAGSRRGGKPMRIWDAHRFSWTMANGPIPHGLLICHRCDNPPCVRPDHLFLGSDRDNKADSVAKGRHGWATGERVGSSKLTAAKVSTIRSRLAHGEMQETLAKEFGVSQVNISCIKRRKTWRSV